MDAPAPARSVNLIRFLPYWAVFQQDVKSTLRSWIYRVWAVVSVGAAVGYLLYRFGAKQVGGFVQPAPEMISDLMNWVALGSITLIIALTSGTICSEYGTMADSVLSRGISRVQYFMGKWHSRLAVVLGTFLVVALVALLGSTLLLHGESLHPMGCVVALMTVASLLIMIVTCGVSVSALSSNTVVSIAVVWISLYAIGFMLSMLPANIPSPDRALQALPNVLKGYYDWQLASRMIAGALSMSLFIGVAGLLGFARRDV